MEDIKKLESEIEERKAKIKALKDIDKLKKEDLGELILSKQEEIDNKLSEYNSLYASAETARKEVKKLREELSLLSLKFHSK